MSHDPDIDGFMPNDGEHVPRMPRPRAKPRTRSRAADPDDFDAKMTRIIEDIMRRDGGSLTQMRYRGRGR